MKIHNGKEMSLCSLACYALAVIVALATPDNYILAVLFLLIGNEQSYYKDDVVSEQYHDEFDAWLQDELDGLHDKVDDIESTPITLEKDKGDNNGIK